MLFLEPVVEEKPVVPVPAVVEKKVEEKISENVEEAPCEACFFFQICTSTFKQTSFFSIYVGRVNFWGVVRFAYFAMLSFNILKKKRDSKLENYFFFSVQFRKKKTTQTLQRFLFKNMHI